MPNYDTHRSGKITFNLPCPLSIIRENIRMSASHDESEGRGDYATYGREVLRKCVREVINNELTTNEGKKKYNIPIRTIQHHVQ